MKHIVIDARLIESSTGRYMQHIVEYINDNYGRRSDSIYTILMPSEFVNKWQKRLPKLSVVAANQKWYSLAEQWSLYWLLRRLKPDLVHFTMPQQPLLWTGPAVTTIHDMTLIRFDNIRPGDNPLLYKFRKTVFLALMRVVIARSKAILTPTEFVRQDLARYFGKKYIHKIHAIPLAGEINDEKPEPIEEFVDKQYLAVVGNFYPYKNVRRVIEAFAILKKNHPNLKLLIAGKKNEFSDQLEGYVYEKSISGIHFLGFISDSQKRWLLQNATAYVTASYSEGFCLPVLEAMFEGSPVVSSDASCLPEVVGSAGILFNPESTEDLVSAVRKLLDDDSLRQTMIKKGHEHATSFSWDHTAEQTIKVYTAALDKL